jgi:hypothetical protein
MIRVYQHPEEGSCSANNACCWVAETIVNGISYSARSRHGAPHELARDGGVACLTRARPWPPDGLFAFRGNPAAG